MFTSFLDRYPNLALGDLTSTPPPDDAVVSAPSTDKELWGHVCRLVEDEKVEVAGAISALKQEFEEQRLDFKDYVSRASREDAAIRISAGKERQKATVAVAELATEVELVKGEVRKLRGQGQQQEREELHLLRQRVGALESRVEILSEPSHSMGHVMTGQLERRLQKNLDSQRGQLQELLQQGLDSQRQELSSHLSGEIEKLQGNSRSSSGEDGTQLLLHDLERLSEELRTSLVQQTQKLQAELKQEVPGLVQHDLQELRAEINGIRRAANVLEEGQPPSCNLQEAVALINDESGKLHASCASIKQDLDSSLQEVHRSLLEGMQKMQAEIDDVQRAAEGTRQNLHTILQQRFSSTSEEANKLQATLTATQEDFHSKLLAVEVGIQEKTDAIRAEVGDTAMAKLEDSLHADVDQKLQGVLACIEDETGKWRTCSSMILEDLDSRCQEVKLDVHRQIVEHLQQEFGLSNMRDELERLGVELGWAARHSDEEMESKIHEVHKSFQDECAALWAELEKLQGSIPTVIATMQTLNFRLQDETGRLNIQLDDLRDSTASVEHLDSRLAQVQARSLEEIAGLRMDFNQQCALPVQGDLDDRMEAVHTRIQEETGKLRAELDMLRGYGPIRQEMDTLVQATKLQLRDEAGRLRAELEGVRGGIDAQEKNIAVCMQLANRDLELRKQELVLQVQTEVTRLRGDLDDVRSVNDAFRHDLDSCRELLLELQEREDLREAREAAPQVESSMREAVAMNHQEGAAEVSEQVRSLDIRLAEVEAALEAESARPAIGLLEERYQSLEQALSLKFSTYDQQLEAFQEASGQLTADIADCTQKCSSIERTVAENTQAIERVHEEEDPRRAAAQRHGPSKKLGHTQSAESLLRRMRMGTHDSEIQHLRAAQEQMLQRWSLLAGQSDSALREAEKHAREPVSTPAGLHLASSTLGGNLGEAQVRLLQQCSAVAKGTAMLEARMSEQQRSVVAALREGRPQASQTQDDPSRHVDEREVDRLRLMRATLSVHQDEIGRTLEAMQVFGEPGGQHRQALCEEAESRKQLVCSTDVDETSTGVSARTSASAEERPRRLGAGCLTPSSE